MSSSEQGRAAVVREGIRVRSFGFAGLHLVALSGFALAQPVFDLLGSTPEFFVVRGSTRVDILVFAAAATFVPAAVLLLFEALASLAGGRAAAVTHLVFVAGFASLLALLVLKRVSDRNWILAAALLLGIAAAAAYRRFAPVRTFLTVVSPAPLVFLALFLFVSPVSKLVLGQSEPVPVAAAAPVRDAPPIVIVLLDELPVSSLVDSSGAIDASRYPNFAGLARQSTWFRNTTTVHEHTTEAIPSVLTGEYPKEGSLPTVADHPENLFTAFRRAYRLNAYEGPTHLCPRNLCPRRLEPIARRLKWLASDIRVVYLHLVLPENLARRLPPITQGWANFGGDSEGEQLEIEDRRGFEQGIDALVGREFFKDQKLFFERFVASIEGADEPTLHFVHVMLPHTPWQYLPSGVRYPNGRAIDGLVGADTWTTDDWLITQGLQRHLAQTEFADRLLGLLVARLRDVGLYDRALVVITADHGVSFRPGDRRRGATKANLHDIAFVPLFVKAPGQRSSGIEDEHVETIDILPTVADLAGVTLPWSTAGHSIFAQNYRGDPKVRVFRRAGEPAVVDNFSSLLPRRAETVAMRIGIFGAGDEGPGLFAIGPHADELVGAQVASLRVAESSDMRAELDGRDLFASVDLEAGVLPARITGVVSGSTGVANLAVAVNGTVHAVTRAFVAGAQTRFSALVPDSAFRNGSNDITIFHVDATGGALVLERIGRS